MKHHNNTIRLAPPVRRLRDDPLQVKLREGAEAPLVHDRREEGPITYYTIIIMFVVFLFVRRNAAQEFKEIQFVHNIMRYIIQ